MSSSLSSPPSPPSAKGVFTAEEVEALERDSLFEHGPLINGMQKVSTAVLDLPDPSLMRLLNSQTAGSVKVSFRSEGSSSDSEPPRARSSLDLAVDPISIAALVFIGFTTPAATAIYNEYISRPDPTENPYDLLDYAYTHVSRLERRGGAAPGLLDVMTPRQALEAVGLDEKTRDTLLDPYFSDIRGTETLCYWVQDTLKMRYLTLQQLQDRLKAQAVTILRGGSQEKAGEES